MTCGDAMSDQLAVEAARKAVVERARGEGGLTQREAQDFRDGFMCGAAWQSAQAAKLLEGVVRERNREPGDPT